jgi:small subunit ribosomal protein S10e
MLMPKKNRIAIYELLFKEGVMVAKKDVHMPKHPELADKNVPNLHVMKAMQVWGRVEMDRMPTSVQGRF